MLNCVSSIFSSLAVPADTFASKAAIVRPLDVLTAASIVEASWSVFVLILETAVVIADLLSSIAFLFASILSVIVFVLSVIAVLLPEIASNIWVKIVRETYDLG